MGVGGIPMTRLLIVEDNFFVADAMRSALADEGFRVVGVTSSPNDALRLAARERPDLALVDVLLSGCAEEPEGVALAARLDRELSVPTLFVTAAAQLLREDEGLGCVSKPCRTTQLIGAVEATLEMMKTATIPDGLPEGVRLWPRAQGEARRAH
jgi:CheY-like chemotaxis protein